MLPVSPVGFDTVQCTYSVHASELFVTLCTALLKVVLVSGLSVPHAEQRFWHMQVPVSV